eukprot:UN4719
MSEFQEQLLAMDIQADDMAIVFSILDADSSGTVSHEEFITELFKMKSHDSHTLLMFIKHHVTQIREQMRKDSQTRKEMRSQLHNLHEEVIVADPTGSCCSYAGSSEDGDAPMWKMRKDLSSQMSRQTESLKGISAELQSLRRAVMEDLSHSMAEIAQRSETHELLYSSVQDDLLAAPCGGRNAVRPERTSL